MEIRGSAYRHGVTDDDIWHALQLELRTVSLANDQVLIIGPGRDGQLLEVVVVDPDDDPRVIHAMPLRRKFHRYL